MFTESHCCRGVLTLYFDDIEAPVEGAVLFSEEQARSIIDFIRGHKKAETLLIHCYCGRSRSLAVGAFAARMLGADNSRFFAEGSPNRRVYDTLIRVWQEEKE